jgi:hypothetical protein
VEVSSLNINKEVYVVLEKTSGVDNSDSVPTVPLRADDSLLFVISYACETIVHMHKRKDTS